MEFLEYFYEKRKEKKRKEKKRKQNIQTDYMVIVYCQVSMVISDQ